MKLKMLKTVFVLLHLGLLVTAKECTSGELRLETLTSNGEVIGHYPQYCYDGEWSMFCSGDGASLGSRVTETVLCRHLGYNDEGFTWNFRDCGSVPTTPDFVRPREACKGTESRIQDCPDSIRSFERCSNRIVSLEYLPACTNGEIRLVGRSTNYREGRVEVCVDGHWGTVCNFSQEGLAGAVCSQLGFPEEDAQAVTTITPGLVPISNRTVQNGNLNCTQLTDTSCDHTMDLGVVSHI